MIAKNHSGRAVRPARYVPSVAIFAWNQDHIGLDVSPIAASTPSPIFSWRCSRFHEPSEKSLAREYCKAIETNMPTALVDNIGDAPASSGGTFSSLSAR